MASPTGRAGQAPRVYRSPSLDSPYRISSASTTNICIPVCCAQQPPMMVSASLYARHLEKEIVLTRYDFSGSTINLFIAEDSRDVNVTCNVSLAEVTDISRFIRHRLALVFGRSPANGNPQEIREHGGICILSSTFPSSRHICPSIASVFFTPSAPYTSDAEPKSTNIFTHQLPGSQGSGLKIPRTHSCLRTKGDGIFSALQSLHKPVRESWR